MAKSNLMSYVLLGRCWSFIVIGALIDGFTTGQFQHDSWIACLLTVIGGVSWTLADFAMMRMVEEESHGKAAQLSDHWRAEAMRKQRTIGQQNDRIKRLEIALRNIHEIADTETSRSAESLIQEMVQQSMDALKTK